MLNKKSFRNTGRQGETSAITCYVKVVICLVVAIGIYALASYIFDLGRFDDDVHVVVPFIWAGLVTYYTRHYVRILVKEKIRSFAYSMLLVAIAFALLGIQDNIHLLLSPTQNITSIEEAISKNIENAKIDEEVKVDFTKRGTYRTSKISHHRNGDEIAFELYVVHPIVGVKNTYYGYRLRSKDWSYSFASDKRLYTIAKEFYESAEDSIEARPHRAHTGYYHRVINNTNDADNYREAYESCTQDYDSKLTPIIFENPDISAEESGGILGFAFAGFAIFTITFILGKKNSKNINKLEKEEKKDQRETKDYTKDYIKDKDNWCAVALVLALIAYYLVSLLCGFSGIMTPAPSDELLRFGGLSQYTFWDQAEAWRIITYAFVHGDGVHLIGNLVGVVVFIGLNCDLFQWFNKSWRILLTFIVSAIVSGLVCITTYDPYAVLVGASGGVMGLYGLKLGLILQFGWDEWKSKPTPTKRQKKSKKKSKEGIQSIIGSILFLGLDFFIIVIPTLLFSFTRGVSMTGHLAGLLTGAVMWFCLKGEREAI